MKNRIFSQRKKDGFLLGGYIFKKKIVSDRENNGLSDDVSQVGLNKVSAATYLGDM